MCKSVLSTYMSVYHILSCCSQRPEQGIRSPGTRAIDNCESPNLGPLKEPPVLLTNDPSSLQLPLLYFISIIVFVLVGYAVIARYHKPVIWSVSAFPHRSGDCEVPTVQQCPIKLWFWQGSLSACTRLSSHTKEGFAVTFSLINRKQMYKCPHP